MHSWASSKAKKKGLHTETLLWRMVYYYQYFLQIILIVSLIQEHLRLWSHVMLVLIMIYLKILKCAGTVVKLKMKLIESMSIPFILPLQPIISRSGGGLIPHITWCTIQAIHGVFPIFLVRTLLFSAVNDDNYLNRWHLQLLSQTQHQLVATCKECALRLINPLGFTSASTHAFIFQNTHINVSMSSFTRMKYLCRATSHQ